MEPAHPDDRMQRLAPGGMLAAHMPAYDAIPNRVMREMASGDSNPGERQDFLDEFRSRLSPSFPESRAGDVPFLFRRLFVTAGA